MSHNANKSGKTLHAEALIPALHHTNAIHPLMQRMYVISMDPATPMTSEEEDPFKSRYANRLRHHLREQRAADLERQFMLAAWDYCRGVAAFYPAPKRVAQESLELMLDAYDRLRAADGPRP